MLTYSSTDVTAGAGAAIFAVVMVIVYVAMIGFGFSMYWRIIGKAGWPGWYSLGLLVPVLNLVLIVMFAFKEWPVETENRVMRQQLGFGGYGGFPPGLAQPPGCPAQYQAFPAVQPGYAARPQDFSAPRPGYPTPEQGQTWQNPTP